MRKKGGGATMIFLFIKKLFLGGGFKEISQKKVANIYSKWLNSPRNSTRCFGPKPFDLKLASSKLCEFMEYMLMVSSFVSTLQLTHVGISCVSGVL